MELGFRSVIAVLIILLVVASACVAPPKPAASANSSGSAGTRPGATGSAVTTTPTPKYVTIETPYTIPLTTPPTTVPTATPIPTPVPDEWVEIYRTTQVFSYNATAFSYDLKNPPMLIHFNLQPVNETGKKYIVKHYGSDIETTEVVTYNYYSPTSWFEVTARDKASGRILAQDGFGNPPGNSYSQNVNKEIKVNSFGEVLVELRGNRMTATVDVSVKKDKNIA